MPFYQWLYITVFTYRKKKKKKRKEKKKRLYTEFLYFESMFLALLGFMLLPSLQSQLLLVFSFNPSCTGKFFALLWLKVCIYLLRPAFSSSSSFSFFFFPLSLLAKRDQPFRMAWLFAAFFFRAKAVGFALQYFTYVGDRRGAWSEMRTNPVYFTIEKLPILCRPTLFLSPLFSFLFFSCYLDLTFTFSLCFSPPCLQSIWILFITNSN